MVIKHLEGEFRFAPDHGLVWTIPPQTAAILEIRLEQRNRSHADY
jgi:hypothetical protein